MQNELPRTPRFVRSEIRLRLYTQHHGVPCSWKRISIIACLLYRSAVLAYKQLGTQVFKPESPTYLSVEAHTRYTYNVPIKLIFVITYTASTRNSGYYERRLYEWLTEIHTILTNQLPWSRVLLEKLTRPQLFNKFTVFHGTRRFITVFTSVRHLSLSWAWSIQSTPPHPTSWRRTTSLDTTQTLDTSTTFYRLLLN
jgi:hypothetical protein